MNRQISSASALSLEIICDLSEPPPRGTSPGHITSPKSHQKKRGRSGALTPTSPTKADVADIYAVRRRSVHSVSYSDLLSSAWRPGSCQVTPTYMQGAAQMDMPHGPSPVNQNPCSPKKHTSPAAHKGKPNTPKTSGNNMAKWMAESKSAAELSRPGAGLNRSKSSSGHMETVKNNFSLPPLNAQTRQQSTSPTHSTGTPERQCSFDHDLRKTSKDWASQTLYEISPKSSTIRKRAASTSKVIYSSTQSSFFIPTGASPGDNGSRASSKTETLMPKASVASPTGKTRPPSLDASTVETMPKPKKIGTPPNGSRASSKTQTLMPKASVPSLTGKTRPPSLDASTVETMPKPKDIGTPPKERNGQRPVSPAIEALFKSKDVGPIPTGQRPVSPATEALVKSKDVGPIPTGNHASPSPDSPKVKTTLSSQFCHWEDATEPLEPHDLIPNIKQVQFDAGANEASAKALPDKAPSLSDERKGPISTLVDAKAAVHMLVDAKAAVESKTSVPMSSLWKKAKSAVKRSISAAKLFTIEGAPDLRESIERLQLGFVSDGESRRVHQVFNRFAHGEEDLDRPVLDHVILHLGYILEDEDVIDRLAEKVTDLSSFDLKELFAFLDEFAAVGKDMLESAFNKRAVTKPDISGESSKTVSFDQIHLVLRDLQIMIQSDVLEEMMQRAELPVQEAVDFDEMCKVVAAYRLCEGFTSADLIKAKEVFEKAEEEADDGVITPDELANTLLEFFGLHCIKHLREMVEAVGDALGEPTPTTSPVSFHEFLIWARRLRNAELFALLENFEEADEDDAGVLSFEGLKAFMKAEGFTLSTCEINEFLSDAKKLSNKSFSFEDTIACLEVCRKSEGFGEQELEDCTAAYNKFDVEEEGEITTLQVLDLLRYLGYQVQVEDVERYANEVDFNGNGTMDVNEYLRLMRLHSEDEIDTVYRAFHLTIGLEDRLPIASLHQALTESKCCPTHCDIFDELRRDVIDPAKEDFSFDEFKVVAQQSRRYVKDTQRKKANFADSEIAVLRKTFDWYDLPGKGWLGSKPVSQLLVECGVPLHTTELRHEALQVLDKARQSCLDADVPSDEVGTFGDLSATYWVMVHTWRHIARDIERKGIAKVDEAREATNFSIAEVTEFQEIFNSRIKKEREDPSETAAEDVNQGRRRSSPELEMSRQVSAPAHPGLPVTTPAPQMSKIDEEPGAKQEQALTLEDILGMNKANEQLSFQGLKILLGHLKLKLSPKNAHTLHMELQKIIGPEEECIDLAGFLHLMRWMLDTNFANLNDKSAVTAKTTVAPSEPKKPIQVEEAKPEKAQQPSTTFLRRASV